MTPEYKRHAYARTILAELRRHLVDRYTTAAGPAKAALTCEEVFFSDRLVPPEAFQEMIQRIKRMEDQEQAAMSEFVTTRRSQPEEPEGKETANEQKGPERRKRRAQGE